MTTNVTKINKWAILNLFNSYLRSNRSTILTSMFLLPIIFIISLSLNYKNTFVGPHVDGAMILMLLWLSQSVGFATQTFVTILLDFKQSIIYRRIGLTRIKPNVFIIVASLYNLMLMLISDLFIFILIVIISFAFKFNNFINTMFSWHLILVILLTLFCSLFLTILGMLMSIIIKTRTGQTISGIIINFVLVIPLFALIFFLNALNFTNANLINLIGSGGLIAIFLGTFAFLTAITGSLYYLSCRKFKWYE